MSTDTNKDARSFAIVSAVTIFVSAFLLFQIQPLISKYILPWFGGTPAVWTTAMLFFQSALLVGYGYAHFMSARISIRRQTLVHCVVLLIAAVTLPIIPASSWKPTGNEAPVLRILLLLLASVGLPYMVLASTGPLVQNWYGHRLPGQSPWRLYALSNVGSLLGLLTFPFVFEPAFTANQQAYVWSGGFLVFAACCAATSLLLRKQLSSAPHSLAIASTGEPESTVDSSPAVGIKWLSWLLLPAVASVMLLALTHHLCQDVAVVPFLWVAPLALYLLSFIICFDNEKWYSPTFFTVFTMLAIVAVSSVMHQTGIEDWFASPDGDASLKGRLLTLVGLANWEFSRLAENIYYQVGSVLAAVFGICMICHGELVRHKPGVKHLTAFYLTVATGGAFGGMIAAVLCPLIFNSYKELHIGLLLSFILTVSVFFDAITRKAQKILWHHYPPLALAIAATGLVAFIQWDGMQESYSVSMRNFYGVLHVEEIEDGEYTRKRLVNGRILHGVQLTGELEEMKPTTYYSPGSGIGLAMTHHLPSQPRRVAVVGLGVGTLATYGNAEDVIRFYEINPDVITLAEQQFTYLSKSPAQIDMILGDARLSMENEEPQNYDIMAIDAFSSDSIPVHLMTKEAVELFLSHLKPDGILAFHVSNRYLNLPPVVKKLADEFELPFVVVTAEDDDDEWVSASTWILLARDSAVLEHPEITAAATDDYEDFDVRLWTDQFSNLMEVID